MQDSLQSPASAINRSAVISLIELVAGAVSQQLLTDEIVIVTEWVGGALIVVGAYLSARAAHHYERSHVRI